MREVAVHISAAHSSLPTEMVDDKATLSLAPMLGLQRGIVSESGLGEVGASGGRRATRRKPVGPHGDKSTIHPRESPVAVMHFDA
jgi:hypothetical protein